MGKLLRTFVKGRMNKSVDERLLPDGEYVDALNIRVGNTETTDIGSVEKTKGNVEIATILYQNVALSASAVCIGSYQDGSNDTIYWMVHDPANPLSPSGKYDAVVSYNVINSTLVYLVESDDDGTGTATALNFNPTYLINGINIIENLLFFTDNYNPPRSLDINTPYSFIVDKDILNVIKAPPLFSPEITLVNTALQVNYLHDRMIQFAYRWKYKNNQYSALSPFSTLAFATSSFGINTDNYTNSGMENDFNAVDIDFLTGDDTVEGIDICFKFADDNYVRVAEKLDKGVLGLPNSTPVQVATGVTNQSITFDNSKTYTILPESEILRLYDNVPRLSRAQSIVGNRLMYANYLEGYDLLTSDGSKVNLDYYVEWSGASVNYIDLPVSYDNALNNILGWGSPATTFTDQIANFDLTGVALTAGTQLYFRLNIEHSQWVQNTTCAVAVPPPNIGSGAFTIDLTYTLPQDYATVYDLATSDAFLSAIGQGLSGVNPNITYIEANLFLASNGGTLTDVFNANLNLAPDASWSGHRSGYTGITGQDAIEVISTPASSSIGFRILGLNLVEVGVSLSPCMAEYFQITSAEGNSQAPGGNKSLHSDRNYEVAMEYLDKYGRATTALVSINNSVYVPCVASAFRNRAIIKIPKSQIAPAWATHYRFLMKPDRYLYQTIYANNWYTEVGTNDTWIQLEGENQVKVEVGAFLRVKTDISGAIGDCCIVEVLDKQNQQRNFLSGDDPITPETIFERQGVYMKLKPNCFDTEKEQTEVFTNGTIKVNSKKDKDNRINDGVGAKEYLFANYEVFSGSGATATRWTIDEGDQVQILVNVEREPQKKCKDTCGAKLTLMDVSITASADYTNVKEFFEGEGLPAAWANSPDQSIDCIDDSGSGIATYYPTMGDGTGVPGAFTPVAPTTTSNADPGNSMIQFFQVPNLPEDYLIMRVVGGYPYCSGRKKGNRLEVMVRITRNPNILGFETIPLDANADLYYEGSQTYQLAPDGTHLGVPSNGDTNQTLAVEGIINLDFFNCFTFGNGIESFRVLDSLSQQFFLFGGRTNAVLNSEYKEIRRFADITYSGTYQTEANINRLNEFNLGLSNYKSLDQSFGDIAVIDGRETDVLVLQEDKISYVLVEKNLLSDSTGGGAITSVPEVLGKQIARVENFGISFNPESYVKWGAEKFFTDAKRGAVLRLTGQGQAEKLTVISDAGMDSWFRDLFQDSFYTQKIGGYDPFMDEYILGSNDKLIPLRQECESCGGSKTITVANGVVVQFCIDYGSAIGTAIINYVGDTPESKIDIDIDYDGVPTSFPGITGSGSVNFNKNIPYVQTATITITGANPSSPSTFYFTLPCPTGASLTVVSVCITSDSQTGQSIHNEYNYSIGTTYFGTDSNAIIFGSGAFPIVSQYTTQTGLQGQPLIPTDNSFVHLYSRQISPDNFVFQPGIDNFSYLRSPILYANTPADIQTLLGLTTPLPTDAAAAPQTYQAELDMSLTAPGDQYLYLVYDYRKATAIDLCYDLTSSYDACCECTTCATVLSFMTDPHVVGPHAYGDVCPTSGPLLTPLYYTGTGTEPELGDAIWEDAAGTIPASVGWYKINNTVTGPILYVDTVGINSVVQLKQLC